MTTLQRKPSSCNPQHPPRSAIWCEFRLLHCSFHSASAWKWAKTCSSDTRTTMRSQCSRLTLIDFEHVFVNKDRQGNKNTCSTSAKKTNFLGLSSGVFIDEFAQVFILKWKIVRIKDNIYKNAKGSDEFVHCLNYFLNMAASWGNSHTQ